MQYTKQRKNRSSTDIRGTGFPIRVNHIFTQYVLFILMLLSVLFITGYELQLINSERLIHKMMTEEIPYEKFRKLMISEEVFEKIEKKTVQFTERHPDFKNMPYADKTGYLTFCMMADSYDLINHRLVDDKTFLRGIVRLSRSHQFQELYGYYKAIINDLEYFPVPMAADKSADISYVDSWSQPRTYGGNRKHEGTDLMASNNQRGFFPVISITDGTVEKMGWLEQGGYRIGIRASCGGYFYYAHFSSYAPELKEGDPVIAGQLLGFMGDSGYGSEGTVGQFDVHLHLGIYVNTEEGEMSINPYWILKMLEKSRTIYEKS